MKTESLEKRRDNETLTEYARYGVGVGLPLVILLVLKVPIFVTIVFLFFSFLVWRTFSAAPRSSKDIFEFYLSAQEILREDDRKWYGFEIREVTSAGEAIVSAMDDVPPLVHYALGALYHKLGEHNCAVEHLTKLFEDKGMNEKQVVRPSADLRDYVRVLRKIERAPNEAPLMSSAVRALERARKNKAEKLLNESRGNLEHLPHNVIGEFDRLIEKTIPVAQMAKVTAAGDEQDTPPRKSISEVLTEIYDHERV